MRNQRDERKSFQTLIEMGKLPADALLSPSKMNEGFYSKTLQKRAKPPRDIYLMGVSGRCSKSPHPVGQGGPENARATDWMLISSFRVDG